ncbi:XRE family transcriptional regulator [uncultured Alistipes sp.]|uniref:XRE family transcriptional regulator n=1 Tax=uncultured Alistipes sp. TaxID=538949 RepID=UPI00272B30BA|nr:XRE family transcriptional regulator [uncultured Alistipes sp.]
MANELTTRFIAAYDHLLKSGAVADQKDFAGKIGVSTSMITEIFKGRSNVGVQAIQNIVNTFAIPADWLLTGRGAMTASPAPPADLCVQEKFPLRTDNLVELQRIPLYSLEATAGLVALFEDTETIPLSYISLPDLPACDGAVHVRGDSMYPLLKSGDIVLYKQVHDLEYGIFWGEMYLVSFNVDGDEFVTIKYIQKSERQGFVKLVSHNPHHDPKEIPLKMIRALALVKASVRYNAIR